jgi:hydroxymethylbilane synthase
LAAKGNTANGRVHLAALIASPDGTTVIRGEQSGVNDAAEEIGTTLAERLLAQGGEEILKALEKRAT